MELSKVAFYLANFLGFGVYFLGVYKIPDSFQKDLMFLAGMIFLAIKIIHGSLKLYEYYLDLIKKKQFTKRRCSLIKSGVPQEDQNPNSNVYVLNRIK